MWRVAVLALLGACRFGFDTRAITGQPDAPAIDDASLDGEVPPLDADLAPNLVFVTSMSIAPSSGVAAIDAFCNDRAAAAHLPGSYVAFLSTSTMDARDRLAGSRGWTRLDGLGVVDQITDFDDPSLPRPILLDETGVAHHEDFVMTGSSFTGTKTTDVCADYASASGTLRCGVADQTYPAFVSFGFGNCSTLYPVYCFGTGHTIPVDVRHATHTGRYIFASAAAFVANTGIAMADAQCQTDAAAAGLPGTYRALLATSTTSIATHLGGISGAWQRPDGIAVTTTGLDQAPLLAVLNQTASKMTWTGNSFLGAPSIAGLATTYACNDWSSTGGDAQVALNNTARAFTETSQFQAGCAVGNRLLCGQL